MDDSPELKPIIKPENLAFLGQQNIQFEKPFIKDEKLLLDEFHIKSEPDGDVNELSSNEDIKSEMIDSVFIKKEPEDFVDEKAQDPLDLNNVTKEEAEEFQSSRVKAEKINNTDQINGEIILTTEERKKNLIHKPRIRVKKYFCNFCDTIFTQKSHLDSHLLIHSGEKPFVCNVCQKEFRQKGNLDSHMLTHTGQKPHVCDVCQKEFRTKSHLNRHKLIHTNERPYPCELCGKSCRAKNSLINHLYSHKDEISLKYPNVAEVCP